MGRIKDKGASFRSSLNGFERALSSLRTTLDEEHCLFNTKTTVFLCARYDLTLSDFVRDFGLKYKDFPAEFEKLRSLKEERKRLFEEHRDRVRCCLKSDFYAYTCRAESEIGDLYDDADCGCAMLFMMSSLDNAHDIQRFAKVFEIELNSKVKKRLDELLDKLKEQMEEVVELYPNYPDFESNGPIDHSQWWKYMDRIVAEKKAKEEMQNKALVPVD
jgi:hypothetical protein